MHHRLLQVAALAALASVLPAWAVSQDGPVEPVIQLGHSVAIREPAFTPDGRWLITAGQDGQVIQWNAETGDLVRSFAAKGFELSPDDRAMLIVTRAPSTTHPEPWDGRTARLVSLETGEVLEEVTAPSDARFYTASITTDGRFILLVGPNEGRREPFAQFWLWDRRSRRFAWTPEMPPPFEIGDKYAMIGPERDEQLVRFCRSVRPDGRLLATRSPIADLSFAPGGRQMLTRRWEDTGSSTDDTTLWDTARVKLLATSQEPFGESEPFRYSPDGARFVRGLGTNTAAIRETATGKLLATLAGHTDAITALDYAPDGGTVLSAAKDGSVRLWDAATGRQLRKWSSKGALYAASFTGDGRGFLVVTARGLAVLYDLATGKDIRRFADASAPRWSEIVATAALAPRGERMVTRMHERYQEASTDTLWNAETGERLQRLSVALLGAMEISPDGQWGLIWPRAGQEGGNELWLWNLRTAEVAHCFERHFSGPEFTFWDNTPDWPRASDGTVLQGWREGYTPAETRLALPREAREVLTTLDGLSAEARAWLEDFILPTSELWRLESNPNDRYVLSRSGRRGARWRTDRRRKETIVTILDLETQVTLRELTLPEQWIRTAKFSPDERQLLIGSVGASLWNVEAGSPQWSFDRVFDNQGMDVYAATFSPDGGWVALSTNLHRNVVVVDARTGERRLQTDGTPYFSPDGKCAVFRGNSDTLWDVEGGRLLHDFGLHNPIDRFVFSPAGQTLWMSVRNETGLYSCASGELLTETALPIKSFDEKTFGLGGARFITGQPREWHEPRTAALWDFDAARPLAELTDEGHPVENATFTPDGRTIVAALATSAGAANRSAARGDGVQVGLAVWDAASGELRARHVVEPSWAEQPAMDMLFTADGRRCATLHSDAAIMWEIASARPLYTVREPGANRLTLKFAPDRQSILTIARGRGATLWDLESGVKVRSYGEIRAPGNGRWADVWLGAADFSPDAQRIVCLTHGGRGIHQISTATGSLVGSFYLLGDGRDAVAVGEDGRVAESSPGLVVCPSRLY